MTSEAQVDDELAAYHRPVFDLAPLAAGLRLPLPDEPFVAFWRSLVADATARGVWPALADRLPQLAFPIAAGISESPGYRAATRRGVAVAEIPEATGLELERPETLELVLHPTAAGHIPLLIARHRPDFIGLLRALSRRNEPVPVPDGQGALMVAGYNNWCRISELKGQWERSADPDRAADWNEQFQRLQPHRELYQDRFILLSDGPYSATPAADLGLAEADWRERSLRLRRDHECAHYFTLRVFGSMRNHLHDELMADYAGIKGTFGAYRAEWFLRFLGAGEFRRPGRRLDLYRGDPPLGDVAFARLEGQVARAAEHLEQLDRDAPEDPEPFATAWTLAALATLTLDELAKDGAPEVLAARRAALRLSAPASR
ncbi:MAG: hypothetical protein SF066_04125 [Thermoanaerobaculia bacterium]|nr:hypothetical protein [Thermoanaerobaculia bacterium]